MRLRGDEAWLSCWRLMTRVLRQNDLILLRLKTACCNVRASKPQQQSFVPMKSEAGKEPVTPARIKPASHGRLSKPRWKLTLQSACVRSRQVFDNRRDDGSRESCPLTGRIAREEMTGAVFHWND